MSFGAGKNHPQKRDRDRKCLNNKVINTNICFGKLTISCSFSLWPLRIWKRLKCLGKCWVQCVCMFKRLNIWLDKHYCLLNIKFSPLDLMQKLLCEFNFHSIIFCEKFYLITAKQLFQYFFFWILMLWNINLLSKWKFPTKRFIEKLKKKICKLIANHKINFSFFQPASIKICTAQTFFLLTRLPFFLLNQWKKPIAFEATKEKPFFLLFFFLLLQWLFKIKIKFLTQLHPTVKRWVEGKSLERKLGIFLLDKNKFAQHFNLLSSLVRFSHYLHTY